MPREVVIVHAGEIPPSEWDASVFLAGPVPRSPEVPSWHPEAIGLLRRGWAGPGRLVVFAPEPREGVAVEGTDSMDWEEEGLRRSDVVLFWIPRAMPAMPGLTTNIEWGALHASGRAVLGVPPGAASVDYPLRQARDHAVPVARTLERTVANALNAVGAGGRRGGGERDVPLTVWRTPGFKRWYAAQRDAGNTLLGARIEWTFRAGDERETVRYWAARVRVRVAAEDRVRDGEIVISRPDTAHVVLYRPAPVPGDTVVVLVRGCRAPDAAPDAFAHDLVRRAAAQAGEATGLAVDADRLRHHGGRQAAAGLSAHHAHLFSAVITEAELDRLRASPPARAAVATLAELHADPGADWAVLGMIAQVIAS